MARLFKNVQVYLGRWDFTGKANNASLDYSVEEKDARVLDSTTEVFFPGLWRASLDVSGLMDLGAIATPTAPEPILWDRIASESDRPVSVVASSPSAGVAENDVAFFFRGLLYSGSPLKGGLGDLQAFETGARLAGDRLLRGRCVMPKGTRSAATGSVTGFQLGAVTSGQTIYAALHVFDVGAGGSIAFVLESDDNSGFTTPTTRHSFTAATAYTEEWAEVAGPITDDYWRISWTRTGGTNFNAAACIAIA